MKILVTGGAGFIGSNVVDALVSAGHDVVVVDDLSSGKRENLNPKARFHQVDIRTPRIAEIVRDEHPDVVSHHAAQMDVRRSVADPVFDAETNVIGLVRLLEASRDAKVRRFLFASSGGAAYGEQECFPAREGDRTNPLSPYGVSKRAGEHYLFCYHALWGLSYVALRYANVYGPRQDPHGEAGVVAIFTQRLLRGESPTINGDGLQTRDYVYVGDVVEANLRAVESALIGPINIGTGRETDVNRLAAELIRLSGTGIEARHGPPKPGEQRRSLLDSSLARKELGWAPTVALEEGLRRTFEWFREKVR
ncbi:MAG: SDR family oxidoreductase [Candidatus Binatia bacterium]